MVYLVDDTQRRAALQFAAARPVEGFDPGFIARFFADMNAMREFSNSDAAGRHRDDIHSEFARDFYEESGLRIPNWFRATDDDTAAELEKQARSQFDTWKAAHPNSALAWPEEEAVTEGVITRARAARNESEVQARRSSSWSSAIGGFLGMATGAMADPINMLSVGFGAAGASGILRTALIEGGIGVASESLVQASTFDFKKQVDPEFSAGDALIEIGAAGAGAAVFGAGVKGIAAIWRRAATGEWPRPVRDAAAVVAREAAIPASRLEKSAHGQSVYRAAVERAADDIVRGKPVEIPQEAFLASNARVGRVYDADGRSVGVRYEVVEARDLVTSHGNSMEVNPAFPAELQPRDRTRAISQDQVQSIAGNLQPERLGPSPQAESGAPIVGPDGFVESGNARVMALRRAYGAGGVPADNYRAFLRANDYDIAGMENPVLIARRVTELDDAQRVAFVTAANRSTALRLGASEQALADARLIDDAVLARLGGNDATALDNRDFVRGFMSKLPRAEQGELVDRNGVLSQAGERRVMAALMGRAYGEPALLGRALEDADSNIKAIAGAMGDAAAPWAKMRDAVARGEIPRGMDITDDLLEAVRLVTKARDESRAVKDMVGQAEMFGGPNEIAKLVARAMFADEELKRAVGRKRLATFLSDYAAEAMKNDAGPRLFGEALGAGDVLQSTLARIGRQDLEAVALARLTPENIEKMATEPATAQAVVEDAQKLLDLEADRAARQGRWKRESERLIRQKGGEIKGAINHPAVGKIDVIWGEFDPAKPNKGGGLAKILAKHPEVVERLPEIVAGLEVTSRSGNRIRMESADHRAVVRLDYDGEDKTWLMTAFEISRRAEETTDRFSRETQADGHSSSASPASENILAGLVSDKSEALQVDLGDGRGARNLSEIMKEADDDLAASADLEACAIGKAQGDSE